MVVVCFSGPGQITTYQNYVHCARWANSKYPPYSNGCPQEKCYTSQTVPTMVAALSISQWLLHLIKKGKIPPECSRNLDPTKHDQVLQQVVGLQRKPIKKK